MPNDAQPGTEDTAALSLAWAAIRRVKDPDLNLSVVDLGLIYGLEMAGSTLKVTMTLTTPACPSGPAIAQEIKEAAMVVPGIDAVEIALVWDPFWTPDRISPRVRAYLGF